MAYRSPRDSSKPGPWWNAPIGGRAWRLKRGKKWKPKQRNTIPKRERAKRRRTIKRHFGLNRRQVGAIGEGHMAPPDGYIEALVEAGLHTEAALRG